MVHEGPFDSAFFSGFSENNGFRYSFASYGEGEKPVANQKVYVHYTGYLPNGQQFDTSVKSSLSKPFAFRLGEGKVIGGWEAVVGGMRPGQRVIVEIPAKFAYGEKGIGPIPPNSPLIFYMELVKLGKIKS